MIADERLGLIYCIRNTVNGKNYVGQTTGFNDRKITHLHHLRKNRHHSAHLQYSWNRYSEDVFQFIVLEDSIPLSNLSAKEAEWCLKLKSCDKDFGYNVQIPAIDSTYSHSEDTKEVLRKRAQDQFSDPEARKRHAEITTLAQGSQKGENNRFYGLKHSPETKAIIREKRKNQKIVMTEERKRKISESNKKAKRKRKLKDLI